MQTALCQALRAPVASKAQTRSNAGRTVVVCRAQQQNLAAKAAAAGVSIPALLAAHPALALVDDRLAGEGTGKILGINDPALFWAITIVFATVWGVFYVSTREVDASVSKRDNDDDFGLTL